jgi:hypothetical protein
MQNSRSTHPQSQAVEHSVQETTPSERLRSAANDNRWPEWCGEPRRTVANDGVCAINVPWQGVPISRAWRGVYLHGFFGVSASIGVAVTAVQVGRFEIVLRENAAEARDPIANTPVPAFGDSSAALIWDACSGARWSARWRSVGDETAEFAGDGVAVEFVHGGDVHVGIVEPGSVERPGERGR